MTLHEPLEASESQFNKPPPCHHPATRPPPCISVQAATHNKLSVAEALERLDTIAKGLQATTIRTDWAERTPAGELQHILHRLEPLGETMTEPYKRFEADVDR